MEKVFNPMTLPDTETEEHSIDATKSVLDSLRDYIKEDEEGDLDIYSKVTVANSSDPLSAVSVKLDDNGSDLSYTLTLTPIED